MMILWNHRFWALPLWPFSLIYGLLIGIRNWCYDREILSVSRLKAKVISVGNLTVGGTGKTPLVEKLVRIFQERGFRVAVISRGYGRKGKRIIMVSDGNRIHSSWFQAGDEPFLLANRFVNLVVIVGKDRIKAGRMAIKQLHCDILILDDGFQYRRLKRNLDLVAIDTTNPWGNGWLVPAGPLREPKKSLRRAHILIFTRVDQNENIDKQISHFQNVIDKPIVYGYHKPVEWISIRTGKNYPLHFLNEKFVLGFAGIGNPTSFRKTLESQGVNLVKFLVFPDHHKYRFHHIKQIYKMAEKLGAVAIVTTEKDHVKIQDQIQGDMPYYYLKVNFEFWESENVFNQIISKLFDS